MRLSHRPDDVASAVLNVYSSLAFRPPPRQFTILASFVLSDQAHGLKVISIGTGSKCLPAIRLQHGGDALHDSHAEVLARRGALRWFLEETERASSSSYKSPWIERCEDKRYAMKSGSRLHLYITTVPCGDASTRLIATFQDTEMATLKNSSIFLQPASNVAARGRDNYSLYGVLRTKPGRADSPPTLSMSCSDKIARWNFLGIQGSLGSQFLCPIYIDNIVIGEVPQDMRETVREDCERALWKRLENLDPHPMSPDFSLHRPTIEFTSLPFVHSKTSTDQHTTSCNDSLCWIAESGKPHEVLINGLKRGVPPKHRSNPKFRPFLSKISLLNLCQRIAIQLKMPYDVDASYSQVKRAAIQYQAAKTALLGPEAPFSGWVKSGAEWECFYANDALHVPPSEHDDKSEPTFPTSRDRIK